MRKIIILIVILLPILLFSTKLNTDGDGYISFTDFSANDALTGTAILYYKPADVSNQGYYIGYYDGTSRLYFRRESNNDYSIGFGGTYFANAFNNSNTNMQCMILMYNNGIGYVINNGSILYNNSYSNSISLISTGWRIGTGYSHAAYMIGDILEFRYYDNPFDTTYAKYISSNSFPPITQHEDSLVIYLSADSISTTKDTIYDLSGNNYHGIITNMEEEPGYYRNNSNASSGYPFIPRAVWYVPAGQIPIKAHNSYTLEVIVQRTDTSLYLPGGVYTDYDNIFSNHIYSNPYRGCLLTFFEQSHTGLYQVRALYGDSGASNYTMGAADSTFIMDSDNNIFISFQWDSIADSVRLYCQKDSTVFYVHQGYSVYTDSTLDWNMTGFNYNANASNNYNHVIKSIRIYKRVLDSTELNYNATYYPKLYSTDSLYFWWNGKHSSDWDTLYDMSGHGNNMLKRSSSVIELKPGE